MKNSIFMLCICLFGGVSVVQAQLKVHENGYVSMQNNVNEALSPLSIGSTGDTNYTISCTTPTRGGINLYVGNTSGSSPKSFLYGINSWNYGNSLKNIGLRGLGYTVIASGTNSPSGIGVNGIGRVISNPNGIAYGVLGNVSATRGVGVCGISSLDGTNSYVDGCYAGLFIGETKVVGNLSITGAISGTMLSSAVPDGVSGVEELSSERNSVSSKLAALKTISYFDRREIKTTAVKRSNVEQEDDLSSNPELKKLLSNAEEVKAEADVLSEQMHDKKHYALSVELLEDLFPDLIYEDKKGTKHINYIEMIPLLVQSIAELHSQLSALTGESTVMKARTSLVADNFMTSEVSTVETKAALLYQNTPNPFTERTEIRFSLPDDVRNAYIYIFDMQGKMLRQIPVDPSMQSITINGYELSAGIYLYSLVVNGQEIDTKRMILSK